MSEQKNDAELLVNSINSATQMLQQSNAQATAMAQDAEDKWFNAWQADVARQWQHDERLQTQEFNVAMWNLENEYNQAMWDKQNAHNSPSAQLKRAMDAGINPNSVINGLDGSNASAPASASSVRSSPTSGAQASHSGGLPSSLLTSDAQYKNLLANARKTNADADVAETQAEFDKASYDDRLRAVKGTADKIFNDIAFQDFTKEQQEKTYEWFALQSAADLKTKKAQLTEIANNVKLIEEKIKSEQKQQNKLDAETLSIQTDVGVKENEILRGRYENQLKELEVNASKILEIPINSSQFAIQYKLIKENKWNELCDVILSTDDKYRAKYANVKANTFGKGTKYDWRQDGPVIFNELKDFLSIFNPSSFIGRTKK